MVTKTIGYGIYHFFIKRVIAFYILIFILAGLIFNFKDVVYKANLKTLNRLMPPTVDYLIELYEGKGVLDRKKLEDFEHYYQKVTEIIEGRADAYGLLGFCKYHLNKREEAIASYKKAITLNSKFFWFYYNLGVIYFKDGRFEEAVDILEKGLAVSLKRTLLYTSVSELLYLPIIFTRVKDASVEEWLGNQLKEGFRRAHLMLIHANLELKNFPEVIRFSLKAKKNQLDDKGEFSCYAGMAFYEMKEYRQALFSLEEAIKKNPELADAYRYWGLTLKALDKEDGSEKVWQHFKILEKLGKKDSFNSQDIRLEIY